ncbi:hypothetical protein KY331_01115 [Candidatus Woesearchaeota archaeon]|nr:hypothetical protein [Candidatus Woesearchaeota archaeon]
MKIFERSSKKGWGNRLNIVDKNNVVVGYDYNQGCCEDFGYLFTTNIENIHKTNNYLSIKESCDFEHEDYVFDTNFYENVSFEKHDGAAAIFKLVAKEKKPVYLVLYNYHNGYYSHGFKMKKEGNKIHKGYI